MDLMKKSRGNLDDCLRPSKELTIENSITGGLMLSKAIKIYPKNEFIKGLAIIINETGAYLGKETPFSSLVMLVRDILDQYPYENLEDVLLALKMGRKGLLSDEFDRFKFNPMIVIGTWLPRYFEKKAEERERILAKKKYDNLKKLEGSGWTDERIFALKKSIGTQVKLVQEKKPSKTFEDFLEQLKKAVKMMSEAEIRKQIQKWKNESFHKETWEEPVQILRNELKIRKNKRNVQSSKKGN